MWRVGCMVWLGLCACFAPTIDPDPQDIGEQNLGPVIDARGVVPSLATFPAVIMVQPESISFVITTVEDPNLEDTLTARFFADGREDSFLPQSEFLIAPTGQATRAGFSLVLRDARLDAFRDANGVLTGRHRLELIVSDRGFRADSGEGVREIPEDGRFSYSSWELEF